jgi:hypothetical protein
MQGTTDKAPIPMENERNGGRISVRRKFANMLEYFNPFSTLAAPEDEDVPAAKRRRLETSTTRSRAAAADADTVVDAHTTDTLTDALTASPDDAVAEAPNDAVTVAATSLPSSQALETPCPAVSPKAPLRRKRGSERAIPRKWTEKEDAELTEAVRKHAPVTNWVAFAKLFPGRSNVQCRNRWVEYVDPTVDRTTTNVKGTWTAEEIVKLTDAVKTHGACNWNKIAALVSERTQIQCRNKWFKSLNPTIDLATAHHKGRWTAEEDAKLIEAVKKHGNKWDDVTALVSFRTNRQCRQRWVGNLEPSINRGK